MPHQTTDVIRSVVVSIAPAVVSNLRTVGGPAMPPSIPADQEFDTGPATRFWLPANFGSQGAVDGNTEEEIFLIRFGDRASEQIPFSLKGIYAREYEGYFERIYVTVATPLQGDGTETMEMTFLVSNGAKVKYFPWDLPDPNQGS